jgi:membrane-associated phospholipid phosphatase
LKKIFLILIIVMSATSGLYAGENVLNYIFLKDFPAMGGAIIENPLKTGLVLGGLTAATFALINNDKWLLSEIRKNPSKGKDSFFDMANNAGDGLFVLAGTGILYSLGRKSEEELAAKIVEGLAVGGLIGFTAKTVIGRQRPSVTDDPLQFWHISFGDMSFPSGHTMVAFTWATLIPEQYGRWWYLATYPAAACVGAARMYKDAHWPSDILVGAALGIFTGAVVSDVHNRLNADIAVEHGYGCDNLVVRYMF